MSRAFKVWVTIAALLVTVGMFWECDDLNNRIRQANHEAEVNRIRTALVEYWVNGQVTHRQINRVNWFGVNPMRLWYFPKVVYVGEFSGVNHSIRKVWYFDTEHECLVYVFGNGEMRAYKVMETHMQSSAMLGVLGQWDLVQLPHYDHAENS
jgi:hypothetical protein